MKIFALILWKRFREDNLTGIAGSLSYTTLLALVPLVTVVVSILSFLPTFEKWSNTIEVFIFDNFTPSIGEAVRYYITDFTENAEKLTFLGSILLVISAIYLFFSVERAFNHIFRVKQPRHWAQRIVIYIFLLVLAPPLITISLWLTSTLVSFSWIQTSMQGEIYQLISQPVLAYLPFLLELIIFTFFYQLIPNTRISGKNALIGAIFTLVLFETAKLGYANYFFRFNSYDLLYGALATIPMLLIWIYSFWMILLVGGLITASLEDEKAPKTLLE